MAALDAAYAARLEMAEPRCAAQLDNVRGFLRASFVQTANIDLSGITFLPIASQSQCG